MTPEGILRKRRETVAAERKARQEATVQRDQRPVSPVRGAAVDVCEGLLTLTSLHTDGRLTVEKFVAQASHLTSPANEDASTAHLSPDPVSPTLNRYQQALSPRVRSATDTGLDTSPLVYVEGLLSLERMYKEGHLTVQEFAQAKASFLTGSTDDDGTTAMSRFAGTSARVPWSVEMDSPSSIGDDISPMPLDYSMGMHANADHATSPVARNLRLRRELDAMTVTTLRLRAECCGVMPLAIERAKDRSTLANLIVLKAKALRSELGHLTVVDLYQRAKQLSVPEDDIDEAAKSADAHSAFVELITRVPDNRAQYGQPSDRLQRSQHPANALDQILVGLKDAQPYVNSKLVETTTLAANVDAPPTMDVAKLAAMPSSRVMPDNEVQEDAQNIAATSDVAANRLAAEQVSLLPRAGSAQRAKAPVTPDDEVIELEKQVAEVQRTKELAKRKADLLHKLAAAEADVDAPNQARVSIGKDRGVALVPSHSSALGAVEPEPEPAMDEEAQAALKVQAMWRGKAGQKQAMEQAHESKAGSDRVVAAKRTIRISQVVTTLLVMLTTALGVLGPTYILGAAYGAVADGEGIDNALALSFATRHVPFQMCTNYCQMEVFAWAMRDTPFVPSTAERLVRMMLTGVGHFLWSAGHWVFIDVQNPENDIALLKGVPGVIACAIGTVLMFDAKTQPFELWRLYRARGFKMPPANLCNWWNMTVIAGRGTLVATFVVCGYNAACLGFDNIFVGISAAFNKAKTIDTYLGEGGSYLDGWWSVYRS
jgi:hypothetical protein